MGSIPLPELAIRPVDTDAGYKLQQGMSQMAQLRSTLQTQALQQQALDQENQLRQIQIQDSQAMTAAMRTWDGKDINDLPGLMMKHGASAGAVMQMKSGLVDYQTKLAGLGKEQLANLSSQNDLVSGHIEALKKLPQDQQAAQFPAAIADLVQKGAMSPQEAQGLTYQGPDQLDFIEKMHTAHSAQVEQALKGAETSQAQNKADLDALTAQYFKNPNGAPTGAPGVTPDAMELHSFLQNNPGKTPADFPAYKAQQTAQAEQPYRIATAEAEGRARQLIQGMSEPVYAYNPQTGQKTLMSKTDALQSGMKLMTPVNEKQVGDDTMLINRLGDVRQKIARYEEALSKIGTTVGSVDQSNIAALIGKGKLQVGAFGTNLPMDRVNALLDQENIRNLSGDAKKLLVAYYNARESMQGYQRVLSGTGRANERAMELNLDALPNPGITDKPYATESLRQFKENLQIVGQGLPKIPGIKSPEEIEQGVTGPKTAPSSGAFNWPDFPQHQ